MYRAARMSKKNSFFSWVERLEWFLLDLLSAIKHHEIQTKMHIKGRRNVKCFGGNKFMEWAIYLPPPPPPALLIEIE